MGEFALLDAFAYVGGHDFTTSTNQWSMTGGGEAKDRTTFRNNGGARRWKVGLLTTDFQLGGLTDLAEDGVDIHTWNNFHGRLTQVITAGSDETEGSPCVITRIVKSQINPGGGGAVGELSAYTLSASGADKYGGIRGTLLLAQTPVSTTGAKGTAVQAGAVGAAQRLFATFHLLGTAGTSITAVLESDDNSNFTSATTRVTFGPLTAQGGTWATPVPGSITDTWWRLRVTAVTGSWAAVAAAMAIE
jgi:hypothetical protein